MAVVERERDEADPAGPGAARAPAPADRTKRQSDERRAAAGRNALIGMVRARTPVRPAGQVQKLERLPESEEPPAATTPVADPSALPASRRPATPRFRHAGIAPAAPDETASPPPPPRPGDAPERDRAQGPAPAAAAKAAPQVKPVAAESGGKDSAAEPDAAPATNAEPSLEASNPALTPALEAVAAARTAVVRVRRGARVHPAVRPFRAEIGQAAMGAWLPLSEAVRRGGPAFRPLRQVAGPLPFATSDWRPRRPHLTVPPSAWVEAPPRRRDLASDPDRPEHGQRFQRFRAEVEKDTPSQVDEEGAPWTSNLPAPVGLPLDESPSIWQRFLRLFKGADHPNAG